MSRVQLWIRKNWQLLLIVGLTALLLRGGAPIPRTLVSNYSSLESAKTGLAPMADLSLGRGGIYQEAAPNLEVEERLVIQNSWMSLLVKNVREIQKMIIAKAEELGGYMVDSYLDSPLGVDSGNVTVRVPESKLNEALDYFRGLGVRVVSESLSGRDVTDQFVDLEARIATLQKTKLKFEEILESAVSVQDILEVQRQIISLQEQIDSLKGRADYLEKSAQSVKITVYLSTDELALPFAPAQPWRPQAIFKQATRSLIKTFRSVGTLGIWLGVYAIAWLPLLLIIWYIKKRVKKKVY
ncbi:DUF4349 domain-containing protein [Candidatus Shapirobacteria bacterium]|nr:DUF4349 domain-containing protein [Candidatus Shapirobacteria bacterium]